MALAAGTISPACDGSLTRVYPATDVEGYRHELKHVGAGGSDVRQPSAQRFKVTAGRGATHVCLVNDGSRRVDRDVIATECASAF